MEKKNFFHSWRIIDHFTIFFLLLEHKHTHLLLTNSDAHELKNTDDMGLYNIDAWLLSDCICLEFLVGAKDTIALGICVYQNIVKMK